MSRAAAVLASTAAALLAGCGGGDGSLGDISLPAAVRGAPAPAASHCPPALANCATASGRVIYVESVDPDGDGDLHVVLLTRNGVTAPGITAVDVSKRLRPRRDPRIGDRISAAGPVFPGSHRQRQIEAIELHVSRR